MKGYVVLNPEDIGGETVYSITLEVVAGARKSSRSNLSMMPSYT